jgi:hypothetical protein
VVVVQIPAAEPRAPHPCPSSPRTGRRLPAHRSWRCLRRNWQRAKVFLTSAMTGYGIKVRALALFVLSRGVHCATADAKGCRVWRPKFALGRRQMRRPRPAALSRAQCVALTAWNDAPGAGAFREHSTGHGGGGTCTVAASRADHTQQQVGPAAGQPSDRSAQPQLNGGAHSSAVG